jgi:hypothetical protein
MSYRNIKSYLQEGLTMRHSTCKVLVHLNTEIAGSNPCYGMDVGLRVYISYYKGRKKTCNLMKYLNDL